MTFGEDYAPKTIWVKSVDFFKISLQHQKYLKLNTLTVKNLDDL